MSRYTDRLLLNNAIKSLNNLITYLESRPDCESLLDQLVDSVVTPFNNKSVYQAYDGLVIFLKDNEYNFPTDFDFEYWNHACKNLISIIDKLDLNKVAGNNKRDDAYDDPKQRDLVKTLNDSVVDRRLERQILLLSVLETISYRYNCELKLRY